MLNNESVLGEVVSKSGESFSRSLLDMIDRLLAANGAVLDDVAGLGVAIGPGSFTGIRIGLATIHGIALSKRLPIYGISTLEAMARTAPKNGRTLAPMLDAGDGEVYYAKFRYEDETLVRLQCDSVAPVRDAMEPDPSESLIFGGGADSYSAAIGSSGGIYMENLPSHSIAAGVAKSAYYRMASGDGGDMATLKPNYIRRGQAESVNF